MLLFLTEPLHECSLVQLVKVMTVCL